jgi:hypothetical protein
VNKSNSQVCEIIFDKFKQDRTYRNYIIDVLEDASLSILNKFLVKCKEIRVFIDSEHTPDNISAYFSILKTANQYFKIMNDFITEDLFTPSMTLQCLSKTLLQYSSYKLFEPAPFRLLLKSEVINSKHHPIVNQIQDQLQFGYFESEFFKMDSVIFVSIIGESQSIVKRVLQSIFHVDVFALEEGGFMYYSNIQGNNFAVLAVVLRHTELTSSSLKIYEFITALSDIIILPVWMKSHEHVPRIISELFYCSRRIDESRYYHFKLEYLVFDWNEHKHNFVYESLSRVPVEAYVALFGYCESVTYFSECLIYQKRLIGLKQRYSGKDLITNIKLVLSQVTTGDTHSQDYWIYKNLSSISKWKGEICEEKNGICDHEVNIINNEFKQVPIFLRLSHSENHLCAERCFKCSCYCQLEIGHFGLHSSKKHYDCDLEFFNEKRKNKDGKVGFGIERKNEWWKNNWETPEESILGLLNN